MAVISAIPNQSRANWREARSPLLSNVLGAAVLALAAIIASMTVWLVVKSYSPAIYWDHWQVLDLLTHTDGHLKLRDLWSQHNEHRIVVERLLCFADLAYFGGRNISLFVEIGLIQAIHAGILIYLTWRFVPLKLAGKLTVAGLFLYSLFSFLQMENFVWAFQVGFVGAALASTGAFALVLLRGNSAHRTTAGGVAFAGALLCALVAEASLANGVFVWPFLILMVFLLRLPIAERWIAIVTSAAAIAAYMIGYKSPGYLNPWPNLKHPLQLLKYILTYFSYSWDANVPNFSGWPIVTESLTFLAILFVVVSVIRCVMSRVRSPFEIFLLVNMLFILATAGITSLGRLSLGYGEATGGRYQTYALLFWSCLIILFSMKLNLFAEDRHLAFVITQAWLVLLLLAAPSRFGAVEAQSFDRQARWDKAMNAVVHHDYNNPAIAAIYHHPQWIPAYMEFLARHHWGPKQFVSVTATTSQGVLRGYRLKSPSDCVGYIDAAMEPADGSRLQISGWAWDRSSRSVPGKVALASTDGTIAATVVPNVARPDVTASLHAPATMLPGWMLTLPALPVGDYRAYGILSGDDTACVLQNRITVQH